MNGISAYTPAQAMADWYAAMQACAWPFNAAARITHAAFDNPLVRATLPALAPHMAGSAALADRLTRAYRKPPFAIPGHSEQVVMRRPFVNLLHFKSDAPRTDNPPRVLLFAPMSGHHATLLRDTVAALVRDHDVYITDWACASQVPLSQGRFSLDTYIDDAQAMMRAFKGDVHVMAVCQPGVPVLAAVSLMEARRDPFVPKSMTLMGSPIDTRVSPTAVNQLATSKGVQWFADNVLALAPAGRPGENRPIYPGILQLMGFMGMNAGRHREAHMDLFNAAARGDGAAMRKHDVFYDEYKSVMDLDAAFYMQTIDSVFVNHRLPKGEMTYTAPDGGTAPVNPAAIARVGLMTVEGARDDITGLGQCAAAHDLCANIPPSLRAHHLQDGAGHYGIFSGKRWEGEVLPAVRLFITAQDGRVHLRPPVLVS